MKYTYYTQGTCSSQIDFELDEQGIIRNVQFTGGCHGNLQGISVLLRGMSATDAIAKLQGIRCGYKNTSCPDQLANALSQAINSGTNS
ncbi:MAG: TIGR03905 family TSCPD domain-containing protein [Muribaculaceae bacterium]|nr:TIGR03905 family TSCPD domain-containing protein [Muribaculaceae bacterium]